MKKNIFTALIFALLPVLSEAQQISFDKKYRGADIHFDYRWQDMHGRSQSLGFKLDGRTLKRGEKEFDTFDTRAANDYAYTKIKDYVRDFNQKSPKPGARMKLLPLTGGYDIEFYNMATSEIQRQKDYLFELQEKSFKRYEFKSFYTTFESRGQKFVMPDHRRIAKRYVKAMQPVAQAIEKATQGLSARQKINYALNFIQSIPYDQLLSRYTSNGAGFQTPYGLLSSNKGDCDTKSVALAAVLRSLFPNVRLMMVYTPGHAFLGFNFQQGQGDYALKINGTTFVLAEPAGPGLAGVGIISSDSRRRLEQGRYSYQEVPF